MIKGSPLLLSLELRREAAVAWRDDLGTVRSAPGSYAPLPKLIGDPKWGFSLEKDNQFVDGRMDLLRRMRPWAKSPGDFAECILGKERGATARACHIGMLLAELNEFIDKAEQELGDEEERVGNARSKLSSPG
ncbi:MAG: hypothetical protein COZ05_08040 [Armatimonadetes bacterium CG_4_10_14_3_um_filter_59_10]|nr:MAG: hypothetical protein COZ05_08040 [Armatimonadetes bacterium CG_4_10_14_3_um_filter_59_10]